LKINTLLGLLFVVFFSFYLILITLKRKKEKALKGSFLFFLIGALMPVFERPGQC